MAIKERSTADVMAALRELPEIERAVFLAMLDDGVSYSEIAARWGINAPEAERAFAAALVKLADALDVLPREHVVRRWLRRIATAARLARHARRR